MITSPHAAMAVPDASQLTCAAASPGLANAVALLATEVALWQNMVARHTLASMSLEERAAEIAAEFEETLPEQSDIDQIFAAITHAV